MTRFGREEIDKFFNDKNETENKDLERLRSEYMRSILKEGFKAEKGEGEDSEDVELESKRSQNNSIFKFKGNHNRSQSPVWIARSDGS